MIKKIKNMLGLIFGLAIGRAFYQLAEEYKKSKWGYGAFGLLLFNICFYVYYMLAVAIVDKETLEYSSSDFVYFIVVIGPYVFALIVALILYILMDKKWKKSKK